MKTKYLYPFVSCICITSHRQSFLLKAIVNFDQQNYPSKELVVSFPADDQDTAALLQQIAAVSAMRLVIVARPVAMSLGAARNHAISQSKGDYICIWDDDDYHREVRLMYQLTSLRSVRQERLASLISHIVLYDLKSGNAYLSPPKLWPGTLLCKRELLIQQPYTDADHDEATTLLQKLISEKYLHYLSDYNLYTFIYHGSNQTCQQHFIDLAESVQHIEPETISWLTATINASVAISLP